MRSVSEDIKYFCSRYELTVILLFLLVFSTYFLSNRYFITIDSAAHLYNAQLIQAKLFGPTEVVNQYYEWNSELVPNLSTHFILVFFKVFLNAADAEKAFLMLYLFLFIFGLRYLIRGFNSDAGILSLLGIPFALGSFLYLGFYNFSFSVVVLFFTIAYWHRNHDHLTIKRVFILGFLLLATYLSHISVFMVLVMILGIYVGLELITSIKIWKKQDYKIYFIKIGKLILAGIIPLVLGLIYFLNRSEGAEFIYMPLGEIYDLIKHAHSTVAYGSQEHEYSDFIFYAVLILIPLVLVYRVIDRKWFDKSDFLLIGTVILFFSLFIVPDSDSKGGYVITRMVFLLYVLLILWITIQRLPYIVYPLVIGLFMFVCKGQMNLREATQEKFSKFASEVTDASNIVEPGSIVLPIWKAADWDWLSAHYSNYLGVNKPVIVLENYEAAQDYFPLRWKSGQTPPYLGSVTEPYFCDTYFPSFVEDQYKPDYIIIYGTEINREKPCEEELMNWINNNCEMKYNSEFCRLYSFRK